MILTLRSHEIARVEKFLGINIETLWDYFFAPCNGGLLGTAAQLATGDFGNGIFMENRISWHFHAIVALRGTPQTTVHMLKRPSEAQRTQNWYAISSLCRYMHFCTGLRDIKKTPILDPPAGEAIFGHLWHPGTHDTHAKTPFWGSEDSQLVCNKLIM